MKAQQTILMACIVVAVPVAVYAADPQIKSAAKAAPYAGVNNMTSSVAANRQAKPSVSLAALKPVPAGVARRADAAAKIMTPQGKAWIAEEVALVRAGKRTPEQAQADAEASGIDFGKMPIEDAIMLMFMLIADDARADTKAMLEDMDATRKKKEALRGQAGAGSGTDRTSDASDPDQLKLQAAQNRYDKAIEALSNLMKKQSDSSSSVTSNMK
jgi:hypothetical protein